MILIVNYPTRQMEKEITRMDTNIIYYKLICIDQEHAKIAELQINNWQAKPVDFQSIRQADNQSGIDNIKSVMLGRALVVKINTDGLDQKDLSEINYLLSCVRVNAMAYDDNEGLSQYDRDEVDKI